MEGQNQKEQGVIVALEKEHHNKELYVDLCVIGAGAAGLSVAAAAVQLGLDVALVEKGDMGGDCLNTGCVPSKALLAAAKAAQNFRTSERFGIKKRVPDIDFAAVQKHIAKIIRIIEPHDSQERFEGMGVKVVRASARFLDPHTIIAGDTKITAAKFVIATGSRARVPTIKNLSPENVLTNETIFDVPEKPLHLVIIGGGPIGVEMAQAHRRLGCEVTILEQGTILSKDDPDLVAVIKETLIKEGIDIHENIDIISGAKDINDVILLIKEEGKERQVKASHVLVAAGREIVTDSLDLDKAGIVFDEKSIKTDKKLRTSQKHIYVAGDVAGGPQFTHVAGYHAGIIIRNMLFKWPAKADYSALPWVTYCDPELAQVGMTESMAREKYGENINVVSWRFKENDRATAEYQTDGLIKVITKSNGKIIGAGIAGPHAGEMIGLWCLAVSQKMKINAIANMIVPYPTYGEVSKRAAGAYYTGTLFSAKTKFFVGLLQKLPF